MPGEIPHPTVPVPTAEKQFAEHMLLLGVEMPQLGSPRQSCQLHTGTFQLAAEKALAPLPSSHLGHGHTK